MIFAVDIGNSNIVIGLLDENRNVVFSGRIRTDRQKTKEEFMIELKTLLDIYSEGRGRPGCDYFLGGSRTDGCCAGRNGAADRTDTDGRRSWN